MLEIHCIKNARNEKSTFDLRWALIRGRIGNYNIFWNRNMVHRQRKTQLLVRNDIMIS